MMSVALSPSMGKHYKITVIMLSQVNTQPDTTLEFAKLRKNIWMVMLMAFYSYVAAL